MEKRNNLGQVTIFIIIAVLIVASVALFFTLRGTLQEESYPVEVESFTMGVEDCIGEVTINCLQYNSERGGYFDVPDPNKDFLKIKIPFYWHSEKSYFLSKKTLESEFSKCLENNLPHCVEKLNLSGYRIRFGNISVYSVFSEGSLFLEINYPMTLKKGESVSKLDSFSYDFKTNFYSHYLLAEKILEEQSETSNSVPLAGISPIFYNTPYTFETFVLEDEVIFSIFEESKDPDFVYSFAIKYDWEGLE